MAKQRVKDEKRVDPRLIHQYLLDKGLSEEHALGMMANMKAESNFIAGRKEEGGGSGIGLFQHSGVRKPKMLAAINNDLQNWKGQIDFALSEADTKNYISKKFSSPEEATIWFMKNWERPADQSAAKQQERIDRFFIGYDKGNYNANYKIPTDSASYTTTPTDLPTNTPDQLRITTLEEQNKQLAEDFKKAHEDLAQKEKLEKESSTVKELTKAEQDQQNRAKFWEAYSAPQEDVAQETPQALPSANDLGLYTQNLGFDVQQAGQLFSTGQPAQQTFAEGGPVNNSIVSNIENGQVDTDAMNAMMKSRMAISAEFGNPAAQRMTSPNPKTYTFTGEEGTDAPIGSQGTHFMASMGEYAVPLLQDKGGNELEYNENPRPSSEDMKFRTPEEAQYFAEHYKEIAPMMRTFAEGGKTGDGLYTHSGKNYKKIDGKWYMEPKENSGEYKLIEKGDVKSRIAELEKNAQAYTTKGPKSDMEWSDRVELSNNTSIGDMLGTPQAAATAALTSNKYTLPSQWLEDEGYSNNPIVGGVADFVLDPMNILIAKSISPYNKVTPASTRWSGYNRIIEPISKFDLMTKPTVGEYAEGGEYQSEEEDGGPIRPYITSDPKEFAFRNKMYADSLSLYNEFDKYRVGRSGFKGENDKTTYINKKDEAYLKGLYKNVKKSTEHKTKNELDQMYFDTGERPVYDKKYPGFIMSPGYGNNSVPLSEQSKFLAHKTIKPIGDTTGGPHGSVNIYKKPGQPIQFQKAESIQQPLQQDTVDTLFPRPIQQFLTPEQGIIPGKPYVKPIQYSGPRYGSLAGDENLDLPAGYTQQEREAARRQRDAEDWLRKTQEYQNAQRGFRDGGKTDKPENYKILPETFNYEGRPGARYRRDNYGNWLVADKNTDGKFVAVKDASGERQAELNRRAVSSETGKTANEYAQKESKDPQKRFEQEAWNDYDKMSTSERVLDRVQAGMVDPIGMASRFISGEQAYIPGMGKGLLNTESGEYQKYLKSVGYTPGKFEASDLQNMLNPMYWGASAGNQLDKGNTAQGLVEAGLAFAGAGQGKNMLQGVKYLADDVVQGSKYLGKTLGTETGLLSNAYKINPNRYTVPDNTYVRQIMNTDEGVGKQLVESLGSEGKVLSPHQLGLTPEERASHWFQHVQNPIEQTMELPNQGLVDLKKADNLGDLPFFQKERLYYGNSRDVPKKSILIESKPALSSDNFTTAAIKHTYYPRNPNDLQLLDEFIGGKVVLNNPFDAANVENFNIYEPHWWKGYKQTGFREGGTQESLLDQNSIDTFKQKYGI